MTRRRWSSLGFRTRTAEPLLRFTANQTEEERDQRMSEEDKEWLECEQSGVQPDFRVRGCEHDDLLRRLHVCFLLNRMNVIGWEWLKDVNKKQKINVKQDSVHSNHVIIIALHFRYNSADDYILSPHVLIGTINEICPYCKVFCQHE